MTNAELIADARQLIRHSSVSVPEHANMLGRLADALEAAERERDEARKAAEDHVLDADAVHVRLSAELREVNQERDALAAVVEKVRAARSDHPACEKHPEGEPVSCGWKQAVLDIDAALATAPADALREVKAEAWDEGHGAGWEDRHQDALAGWMTSGPHESEAVNPYREEQS